MRTYPVLFRKSPFAIANIELQEFRDQYAYKVIMWDLARKAVLQTINHEIVLAENLKAN